MPTRAAEGEPVGARSRADRLDDGEPGAHGALGRVLVRRG